MLNQPELSLSDGADRSLFQSTQLLDKLLTHDYRPFEQDTDPRFLASTTVARVDDLTSSLVNHNDAVLVLGDVRPRR